MLKRSLLLMGAVVIASFGSAEESSGSSGGTVTEDVLPDKEAKEAKEAKEDNELESFKAVSDEDFEQFESILGELGEEFDPSHILTFSVAAGDVTCFYEHLTEDDLADDVELISGERETRLVGALFLSGGSNRDINLQVIGPGGDDLLLKRAKGEDSFDIPVEKAGIYEICFGNQMSSLSAKVVTCALHFQIPDKQPEHLQTEDLLPTRLAADEASKRVRHLNRELRYLEKRYENQKFLQEHMNLSVLLMGFLRVSLVIMVMIAQICFITNLPFKKMLGRVLDRVSGGNV